MLRIAILAVFVFALIQAEGPLQGLFDNSVGGLQDANKNLGSGVTNLTKTTEGNIMLQGLKMWYAMKPALNDLNQQGNNLLGIKL